MGKYYVGLDLHSQESVFVVKNDEGALVARGSEVRRKAHRPEQKSDTRDALELR